MNKSVLSAILVASLNTVIWAATHVQMEACKLTPDVKKELNLTPQQEPKVNNVFSDVAPKRQQIEKSMQERQNLVKSGADEATLDTHTKKLIKLENQCREDSHRLLKPILTGDQYSKLLEMEEAHRKFVMEREEARKRQAK